MTQITEIAPDMYRISTFIPEVNLQFNQFLVRDDQPLLFHTGMKGLFPVVRDAVATYWSPPPSGGSAPVISRQMNAAPSRNGRRSRLLQRPCAVSSPNW